MKQFSLLFLIFMGNFLCSNLLAQSSDSISTQHIHEITVVSTNKPSETLSTNSVQTLTSSDIDRIGIQSVSDAIRRLSGVVVKDYGGIGGMKTVSIRGNGAEHTSILYDGMAVSNTQTGQVDIGKFSLENISMLSLTVGQSDDIFRSAKAISSVGALDIQTRVPHFQNKLYQLQSQIKTGSWGLFNPYIYGAYKINDKFSASLDGSWERADGRYSFTRKNVSQTIHQKRQNTDVDVKRTELNLFGNLTDKQYLSLKSYYYDSERGVPGMIILDFPFDRNQRIWDRIYFTQAKYDNQLNEKFHLQLQGKYSYTYMKYIELDKKYPEGILKDRYNQNEWYFTGILGYKLNDRLSFSFAEDFVYNILRANSESFPDPNRYTSLTSLSAKYEIKRLTLIGNILGTYIAENVKSGKVPHDRKKLSPALSASYRILNKTNLRLRASYKDIFRTPTFNDLYYNRVGNINLKPEKARQYNFGLTWSNQFSKVFNFFNITTDFYYNTVKDKIIVSPSADFPKMINFGKVYIKGIDVSSKADFELNSKISLLVSCNYTYQKAIDQTDKDSKNYNNQIPYTPRHSGAASLSLENPWVNFSYSLLASSNTYDLGGKSYLNRIDGYIEHSISLNRSLKINKLRLRVQADIINLANKTYYVMKDYPMPGRQYRISFNVKY